MSRVAGKIDLAKFREANRAQRKHGEHRIQSRAVIRLVEDQLKEARVGEYTIFCDEARSRKGGGRAPGPLSYFIAAVGF